MGQSQQSRLWLAVAVAALLAMATVVLVPTFAPLGTSRSPLPAPADAAPTSDASGAALPPLAKIGLTLLWVALGVGVGVAVILTTVTWYRRSAK